MIHALRYLIEFCYLVRRDFHTTTTLEQLERVLDKFHKAREIFVETKVRDKNPIPPRQHSLVHYPHLIREFGSPNGLCSSITEAKHIKAVKEPWRRSNRWEALYQMLTTILRLDKLAASETLFKSRQLLDVNILSYVMALCKC